METSYDQIVDDCWVFDTASSTMGWKEYKFENGTEPPIIKFGGSGFVKDSYFVILQGESTDSTSRF
jgi:hypothetical protein